MVEAYYVSLAREYLHLRQALRNGVAGVSGDLEALSDQILTALDHLGDTSFAIDRWARQVTAEQDALDHLELLAQMDEPIACEVCGERPAVFADDEVHGSRCRACAIFSRRLTERRPKVGGDNHLALIHSPLCRLWQDQSSVSVTSDLREYYSRLLSMVHRQS